MADGCPRYSPCSGWTRRSAISGSSLPFGNQAFSSSDHFSSILALSRTISALPVDGDVSLAGRVRVTADDLAVSGEFLHLGRADLGEEPQVAVSRPRLVVHRPAVQRPARRRSSSSRPRHVLDQLVKLLRILVISMVVLVHRSLSAQMFWAARRPAARPPRRVRTQRCALVGLSSALAARRPACCLRPAGCIPIETEHPRRPDGRLAIVAVTDDVLRALAGRGPGCQARNLLRFRSAFATSWSTPTGRVMFSILSSPPEAASLEPRPPIRGGASRPARRDRRVRQPHGRKRGPGIPERAGGAGSGAPPHPPRPRGRQGSRASGVPK